VKIDGNSSVTLSGHSQIDTLSIIGGPLTLAAVKNGGDMVFSDSSVVDITYELLPQTAVISSSVLLTADDQDQQSITGGDQLSGHHADDAGAEWRSDQKQR
jgi:putative surface-exposed virulence protein